MSRVEDNKEIMDKVTDSAEFMNKASGMVSFTPEEINGMISPLNLLVLCDISKSLAVIADKMEGGKDGH